MNCSKEIQKHFVKYVSHFILNTFSKFEEVDRFYSYPFLVSSNAIVDCYCSRHTVLLFCRFIPSVGTIQMKQLEILHGEEYSLSVNQYIYWSSKYFPLCQVEKTFSTPENLVIESMNFPLNSTIFAFFHLE